MHFCQIEPTSSGSPILRIANKKVIGVHKKRIDKLNCSKGTFLKYSINDFKNFAEI